MNRLQLIRDYEKKYHDDCYENQILFQSGSWLEKPVRTVLDLFGQLERRRGIHALIVNAGVREVSLATGEELDPKFELLLDAEELGSLLAEKYRGWELLRHAVKPYALEIERDGVPVSLSSDVVTWAARKRSETG